MRIGRGLRIRLCVVAAVALVAVITGEGDASGDKADRTKHAKRRQRGLVSAQRLFGDDFAGERMLRRARDRIAGETAVFLHTNQRALPLAVVIFDDEIGLAVAVKADEQIIARARSRQPFRAEPGGKVGELVVDAVLRRNARGSACGIKLILGDGVASGVVNFKGDEAAHGGSRLRFYCRLH